MEAADVFIFNSIEPITVPVTIAGEEFVLREAFAGVVAKYRNIQMRATKFDDGKMCGVDGAADSEPYLLSLCMFTKDGSPVGIHRVLGWPERVVKPLIAWVKEHSAIGEQTVEAMEKEVEVLQKRITVLREKESVGKN